MVAAVAIAALGIGVVVAQQSGVTRGNHDWAPSAPTGKHHTLAATLDTVQWGWLDPREKPKLVVDSGDTVSIETMMHAHDKVQPGMTIEQATELRKANPGGGPHSMTGPIYVNGVAPGDVMEIRILRIEPKPWTVNFNLPGKEFPTIGALASEMPEGYIKFFPHDLGKRTVEFKPGIVYAVSASLGVLVLDRAPQGAEHIKQLLIGSMQSRWIRNGPSVCASYVAGRSEISAGDALALRHLSGKARPSTLRAGAAAGAGGSLGSLHACQASGPDDADR